MFDEAGKRRRQRRAFQRQERMIADTTGGRVTPASGAIWGMKGDVQTPFEVIEAKRTDGKGMRVEGSWLRKVEREAAERGREPVIELEIDGLTWRAMPVWVHEELRERGGRT